MKILFVAQTIPKPQVSGSGKCKERQCVPFPPLSSALHMEIDRLAYCQNQDKGLSSHWPHSVWIFPVIYVTAERIWDLWEVSLFPLLPLLFSSILLSLWLVITPLFWITTVFDTLPFTSANNFYPILFQITSYIRVGLPRTVVLTAKYLH